MENLKHENLNQREQLNNKIKIAKRILISSWIDMDAEYKSTRKSAFISAMLAVFFLIFSVIIVIFALTYHVYFYEQELDSIRKNYSNQITNLIDKFNESLDEKSNYYYNYVLSINSNDVDFLTKKAEFIKEHNEKTKLQQAMQMEGVKNSRNEEVRVKLMEVAPMILLPIMGLNLFLIVLLLRHQKKLLSDVRYFSHMKYQIRLFSNLLDASQYVAAEMDDYDKAAKYVEDTFTSIREQLLLIGNSQHVEESQNADNDNALLTKILDIFSGQQNQNKQQS